MAIAAYAAINDINEGIEEQAQRAIDGDLNSSNEIFRQREDELAFLARVLGRNENMANWINTGDLSAIAHASEEHFDALELCFLTITDSRGRVVYRANQTQAGDNLSDNQYVQRALRSNPVSGNVILNEEFLSREGLSDDARLNIRDGVEQVETRGMSMIAANPIYDQQGNVEGTVILGELFNNNFRLVDQVGDLLDVTATIFFDDLRVSTNVTDLDGERAIGTFISDEVGNAVLNQEERFLGTAFVVTEDYVTAYDPIRTPDGEVIGINYVGIPEAPFDQMRQESLNRFILIAIGSIIMAIIIAVFITRSITTPVTNLMGNMQEAEKGDLTVDLKTKAKDELGKLIQSFNGMLNGQTDMIKKVLDASGSVAEYSQGLSSSVEESNAAMQEISTTIEGEIAKKAQEVSSLTKQATEDGGQAQETAEKGGKAVEDAVQAMMEIDTATSDVGNVIEELNESSKQIGVIVNTITNIAEQTNLLALNAAIEAARAGDHGSGFAVVAEEVRKLAEGSSQAAGEIENLISDIQGKTSNAVEKMNSASETVKSGTELGSAAREHLQEIRGAIDKVSQSLNKIATAVEEQSASVQEISASTEQQTSVFDDISKTANELASMSDELKELMSKFTIDNDS